MTPEQRRIEAYDRAWAARPAEGAESVQHVLGRAKRIDRFLETGEINEEGSGPCRTSE